MPKRKVSVDYNFEKLFPQLKEEWDELRNNDIGLKMALVSPFSDKKAHWICRDCGHEWPARIANRSRKNSGCPACATNGKAVNEKNSLAAKFPEIASTWHPTLNGDLTPQGVRFGSKKVVYWQCLDYPEHVFPQLIATRTFSGKATCKICNGKMVTQHNALTTTHPDLIQEWDWSKNTFEPSMVTAGSSTIAHWRCKRFPESHRWPAQIKNRALNESGCRYCNNQGSVPEIRLYCELKVLFPDAEYRPLIDSTEIDILLPSINLGVEYDGSYWHKEGAQKDLAKNEFLKGRDIDTLRVRHKPLPAIGQNDVLVEKSTLSKSDLDKVVLAIYALRGESLPGNAQRYLDKKTFQAELAFKEMTSILPGLHWKNNAAEKAPHLLDIYSSKNPLPLSAFSFGSGKSAIWECIKKDHPDYEATIKNKVNGDGCRYCTKKLLAPEDSLAAKFPEIATEWDIEKNGRGPEKISYGSSAKKHWWKCHRFGHSFEATVNNRTSGTPCPNCPRPGYSLADRAPQLEFQWLEEENDGLRFAEIPSGRKTKYWWRCKVNPQHPYFLAAPANMCHSVDTLSGGCDICRRRGSSPRD